MLVKFVPRKNLPKKSGITDGLMSGVFEGELYACLPWAIHDDHVNNMLLDLGGTCFLNEVKEITISDSKSFHKSIAPNEKTMILNNLETLSSIITIQKTK